MKSPSRFDPDEPCSSWLATGLSRLHADDPALSALLDREHARHDRVLQLVASSSPAEPSVMVCEAMRLSGTTTEGYPGARFHGGGEVVDDIERLAISRACTAFGARFANIQPHSGTSANIAALIGNVPIGATILGMNIRAGGHLSHGASVSISGLIYQTVTYGVDHAGIIDYDDVRRIALQHRPRLIIAGASSYPRRIDYPRFRAIADEVDAILLADVSHIAGLVISGEHPSPIDIAHITTTSTYKQLRGPRGGLILSGRDSQRVADACNKGVFPRTQGTPHLGAVAAKARCLALAHTAQFTEAMRRVRAVADVFARRLIERGHRLVTGGTDNHMILVDLRSVGLTGLAAERSLERCGIITNRNRIPDDPLGPATASGLRIGSNEMGFRGFDDADARRCADLVDGVLRATTNNGDPGETIQREVSNSIGELLHRRPLLALTTNGSDAE